MFDPILAAAEEVLSKSLDREVRLGDVSRLSDEGRRNLLLRCRNLSVGSPASVIIKGVVVEKYNPEDTASWDTRRFFSDWAGAQFLSAVLGTPRSPRFYGGHYSLGFFILEDLGDQRSLVEPLLEETPSSAERVLLSFSTSLAAVHAETIGRSGSFEGLLRAINPSVGIFSRAVTGIHDRLGQMQTSVEGCGVRIPAGFTRDVEAVATAIDHPGPFLSYIHGDPCPDNVSWNGDALRLIDFEFGGFGHALLDGSYGRMLFPTCWCANRLPDDLITRMEAAYRTELIRGCPEAQEDRIFEAALTTACGFWLLNTLERDLPRAVDADRTWGIATMRQRVLARLRAFMATADMCDQLPALRGMAARLLEVLNRTWPETPPLPLYPAFRLR